MARSALSVILIASTWLAATPTRADMLAPGFKKGKTSIRVAADLPAGKALVLLGTTRGVQQVTVGVPLDFSDHWKNNEPALELYLIAADQLPQLAELQRWNNDHEVHDLLQRGLACGSPFRAEHALPASSTAVELRHEYRLHTTDGACTAEFVSLDQLDADQKVITRDTTLPPPPITAFDIRDPPPQKLAWRRPPGATEDRAETTATGCGSCSASTPTDAGLALLSLMLLLARRAQRARATSSHPG